MKKIYVFTSFLAIAIIFSSCKVQENIDEYAAGGMILDPEAYAKLETWEPDESFGFANDVVTASYGTATPKAIDDVTDEDGNVTRGLKYNHKQVINQQAGGMLSNTDWYVIREADGGTAVPSDITTHRAAVRTKANEMCTAIDDAADVDALAALYEYNDAEPPVRPLGEFPVLDV